MKKISIVFCFFVLFATSCTEKNKNEFYIKNSALAPITMNFKGQLFTVNNGSDLLIDDISNGTFEYVTTYYFPAGVDTAAEGAGLTNKILFNGQTRWSLQYTGSLKVDDAGKAIYNIGATLTSSNSSTALE